jgi:phospholipid transport system transporter-binding protein
MLNIHRDGQQFILTGPLDRDTVVTQWPFTGFAQVAGDIRFNLAGVTHVDTAGIAWLLEQMAQAKAQQRQLHLLHWPAQLVSLATVSGVTTLLTAEALQTA